MRKFLLLVLALCLAPWAKGQTVPSLVQSNYAIPTGLNSSVAVAYNSAQTTGNLNLVVVGWNDSTATVSTITDTSGNVYQLAVGPTVGTGITQSTYFAQNIVGVAAGANTVTVTFSQAANYPDVRVMEYTGVHTGNPIDVVSGGFATSSSGSSGSAVTTHPYDLVVGAGTTGGAFSGPGTGFTQDILNTNGDIVEHEAATTVGSYTATAPLSGSANWVMQMVVLRDSFTVSLLCQAVPAADTIQATASETTFATKCVIPPNTFMPNTIIRIVPTFQFKTGSTATSFRVRAKLGSTYIYDSGVVSPSTSVTRNGRFNLDLGGLAAPGSSVSVAVDGSGFIVGTLEENQVATPITGINTQQAQTITFTVINGAATSGNSTQLVSIMGILVQ